MDRVNTMNVIKNAMLTKRLHENLIIVDGKAIAKVDNYTYIYLSKIYLWKLKLKERLTMVKNELDSVPVCLLFFLSLLKSLSCSSNIIKRDNFEFMGNPGKEKSTLIIAGRFRLHTTIKC